MIETDLVVTRLLCAGAHLDSAYCGEVLTELLDQRHRRVAPAFGYDTVAVLAHALESRRRRRLRALALVACVAPLFLAFTDTDRSTIWVCVALWLAWLAVFVERLVRTHTLMTSLPRGGPIYLRPHKALQARAEDISRQQHLDSVYYSGPVPFVGAGTLSRSWSFAIVLRGADGEPERFTADELVDDVCAEMTAILKDLVDEDRRVGTVHIARRRYATRLLPHDTEETDAELARDGYGSARSYATVQVGTWDNELVTSIFVGFDVRADTLYTELHSYVLHPVRAGFHEVDRLPERLGVWAVLLIAVRAPLSAVADIARGLVGFAHTVLPERPKTGVFATSLAAVGSLFVLWSSLADVRWAIGVAVGLWLLPAAVAAGRRLTARRTAERAARRKRDRANSVGARGLKVIDFGARAGVRALGADTRPHNFFQQVDQEKYTKIIERRVTDVIHDFLRGKRVDLSEFDNRRQTVLNYGVLNMGSGQVLNTGAMAVGTTATATRKGS
ncbi:hypothetical protein [Actinokineospora inagensis]|uniref:hypothetical protein n=1 Tax=Actinokineospora inagensis TaxID=103730 RepID=UPI00041C9327|nr:hypothetical protein [Actinokineospora inagensis]